MNDHVSFEVSGLLKEDERAEIQGHILPQQYLPADACVPDRDWRLICNDHIIKLSKRCYILGYGSHADIQLINDSYKGKFDDVDTVQAILYFRYVNSAVRPYLLDYGSRNGTRVNGTPIEPMHYFELRDRDVINFGLMIYEFILVSSDNYTIPPMQDLVSKDIEARRQELEERKRTIKRREYRNRSKMLRAKERSYLFQEKLTNFFSFLNSLISGSD